MWKHLSSSPPSPKQRSLCERHWNHKVVLLVDMLAHGDCKCWALVHRIGYDKLFSQNAGVDMRDDVKFALKGRSVHCQPDLLCPRGVLTDFYSRDIAVCDFHLFGPHKKHQVGKSFTEDADVKEAVTSWLQKLDIYFFYTACKPCCHGRQRDA